MMSSRRITSHAIAALSFACTCTQLGAQVGRSERYILIRRDHRNEIIELAELQDHSLVIGNRDEGWKSVRLEECVALVHVENLAKLPHSGLLQLTDGQRFSGEALPGARAAAGVFVWNQSGWLGRMHVPLDRIDTVTFAGGVDPPAPGQADVIALANQDRMEGFIDTLGDPVVILAGDPPESIEVPLEHVDAVNMVTGRQTPTGTRLWLSDGTVIDVRRIQVADDGVVRLSGLPLLADTGPRELRLRSLVAVLFDLEVMVSFADLEMLEKTGPPTRYVVPDPEVLDTVAPLGLGRVVFSGPLRVRYRLPSTPVHFSAHAALPETARRWSDFELIVRDDEAEVFRARLNPANPEAEIELTLEGASMQIELTEGNDGPIQDHVIFHRAMLLLD